MTMRLILVAFVVIIGANIGISAVNSVSKMQDTKMTRLCQSVPVGASYDEMCRDYR
jgi:hypothetical protein|tara:strand:+ start:520 stop:687 length:168 start_codon:yes stop_codon:yes gene_type:complete